jgi:CRISPR system Cascade subunit CasD
VVHRTRRDELAAEGQNTRLSQRDYRSDALYTIALWQNEGATETLQQLAEALSRPIFPLYLGRKSCPVALPLAPQIVPAGTLREAFAKASFPDEALLAALPLADERLFVWEELPRSGMEALHVGPRRDEPISRKRWQFGERDEYYRSESRHSATRRNA